MLGSSSCWQHRLLLLRRVATVCRTQQPLLAPAVALARSSCASSISFSSSTAQGDPGQAAAVVFLDGLPRFRLPLPSRSLACQFTLKPLTDSVGDLARCIRAEDRGLELVAFYTKDGVRIAGSDPVDSLLRGGDFDVQLNDLRFTVTVPELPTASASASTSASAEEGAESRQQLESVRNGIARLYTGLNVRDFQLARERQLLGRLESLRQEVRPLEDIREQLADKAAKRTRSLTWLGLSFMGLQFGFLARLTWWEYSWDIMEPVIYFVGYGTVLVAYSYYVVTKQEYTFPQVWDREYLKKFYSDADKASFDVAKYNGLRERITDLESDLRRLRDPLMGLRPPGRLLPPPPASAGAKATVGGE